MITKVYRVYRAFKCRLMSEEKSVSAGSLFHTLMTRSQKNVVQILRLFDFLNNLYVWPLVCVTVEYLKKSFVFTITMPKTSPYILFSC